MATSPVPQVPVIDQADDVFERLAKCDRLLTARELGDILAISPKTLYNYVTRGMIPYFKIESNVRFRASGRRGVASATLREPRAGPGGLEEIAMPEMMKDAEFDAAPHSAQSSTSPRPCAR